MTDNNTRYTEIEDSNILITGGTGSFGNRVASRLSRYGVGDITILSRDEKKQYEMRKRYPDFKYVIADVRDYERVKEATKDIDIIFNAAALKQVPSCELWPEEAIKTNTLGALNVCRAAIDNDVNIVIGLSTDKAVKPINAMGMSKALMEKIICSFGKRFDKRFCCVRYGNVMRTRGSVIPLFIEQINKIKKDGKGYVTVTVPEMTRFMLTLDDAVELVLHAVENGESGDIFVKKAPACRMDFLAKCMIQKYGNDNGIFSGTKITEKYNIETKIVGIRAGEKLHETLINEYEMLFADDVGDYYKISEDIEENIISGRIINGRKDNNLNNNLNNSLDNKYEEYTSLNTRQITDYNELSELLDKSLTKEVEPI